MADVISESVVLIEEPIVDSDDIAPGTDILVQSVSPINLES